MQQESFQNWPKSVTLIVWMGRLEYWLTNISITVISCRSFSGRGGFGKGAKQRYKIVLNETT